MAATLSRRIEPRNACVTGLGSHTPAQSASSSLVSGKRWVSSRNARRSSCKGKAAAELGSHFASKAMGARSREPRAKIFARSANILVFAKRCGIRFAFAARKSVGAGAHDSPFARWIFRVVESPTPTVEA